MKVVICYNLVTKLSCVVAVSNQYTPVDLDDFKTFLDHSPQLHNSENPGGLSYDI